MKVFVKNMVCDRCVMAVNNILYNLGYTNTEVILGCITFPSSLSSAALTTLQQHLNNVGFEIIDHKKQQIVNQIKSSIIQLIHKNNNQINSNLSVYLQDQLGYDYTYLSNLFSDVENISIEKFHINQKIERVKELLSYGEFNLQEIANLLNYSSVAYLSNQFKKIVGMSPTQFKKSSILLRIPLDKV